MSSNFNIDDYLKQSMDEFEFQPRINSFDAVMDKLAKKKRRRIIFILFFGLGIGLLGSLAFIFTASPSNLTAEKNKASVHSPINHIASESIAASKPSPKEVSPQRKLNRLQTPTTLAPVFAKPSRTLPSPQYTLPQNATADGYDSISQLLAPDTISSPVSTNNPKAQKTSAIEPLVTVAEEAKSDSTKIEDSLLTADAAAKTTALIGAIPLKADSQVAIKKNRRFMIGINANPQYSSLLIRENENRSPGFDTTNQAKIAESYLKSRKENNSFNFNYALGIKFGYQLNDKWEVWINGGFQRSMYFENYFNTYQGNTLTGSGAIAPGFTNNTKLTEKGYKNEFYYRTFGVNFSRTIHPNPFLTLKFDAGLTANNLFLSRTTFFDSPNSSLWDYNAPEAQTSKWTYSANLKLGIAKQLTNRMHCRLSPGLFFSPTSMFKKNYVIKQHNYGVELEGALIFNIF